MLIPAWRLPALLVAASLILVALLPGASPTVLFSIVVLIWIVAAGLFAVLHRRERSVPRP